MDYTTLGRTGLLVSKLCFGTMTFGDGRGIFKLVGAQGQAEADALIRTSVEAGVHFFDTADLYTEAGNERILGQSLKNLDIARKDIVIATKVCFRFRGPTGQTQPRLASGDDRIFEVLWCPNSRESEGGGRAPAGISR
jgi:aryl-alcohol dehydrogenase-like predicted oxidoreductase